MPFNCELIDSKDLLNTDTSGNSLINQRAVHEAVAENDFSFLQRRQYLFYKMLAAAGGIQQCLTAFIHCRISRVQYDAANLFRNIYASRFSCI